LGNLDADFETTYSLHKKESGVYAFVIKGDVTINNIALNERDGLGITEAEIINIRANSNTELLLIEVPMNFN
jgi:redox-sensitive bicupin YhaK (pirin superfamily)